MYTKLDRISPKSFHYIRNIYIMLDRMDDISCRYCPLISNTKETLTNNSTDIITFIQGKCQNTTDINLIFYCNDIPYYWDYIMQIYNALQNNIYRIIIITSGKSLNNDIIYKINTNNISIEILLPDKLNENKTYDILEKEKDLLLKICDLTFHCRLSANNYPYDAYLPISLFDKQYVQIHRSYHTEIYLDILHNNLQSINMTEWRKQMLLLIDENKQYRASLSYNTPASKLIQAFQNTVMYQINDRYDRTICNTGIYNLNLDLSGNYYFCPNTKYPISTIYDDNHVGVLMQKMGRIDSSYKLQEQLNCHQCDLYNYCTNCFDVPKLEQKTYCEVVKATWEPILEYCNSLPKEENNNGKNDKDNNSDNNKDNTES